MVVTDRSSCLGTQSAPTPPSSSQLSDHAPFDCWLHRSGWPSIPPLVIAGKGVLLLPGLLRRRARRRRGGGRRLLFFLLLGCTRFGRRCCGATARGGGCGRNGVPSDGRRRTGPRPPPALRVRPASAKGIRRADAPRRFPDSFSPFRKGAARRAPPQDRNIISLDSFTHSSTRQDGARSQDDPACSLLVCCCGEY